MQSSGTGLHRARIRSQSGSVAMLGALWLMIVVICLATIDIGNVFWQKRELQKIADLAALAGASGDLQDGSCEMNSAINSKLNGIGVDDGVHPVKGYWKVAPGEDSYNFFKANFPSNIANACRVIVEREVPIFFILLSGINSRKIEAVATALQMEQPISKIVVRSSLVTLDTEKSAILDAIVGNVLGGNIKLGVVGWNGLLGAKINLLDFLDALAVKIDVNAGDYEKILKTEVQVGKILQVALDILRKQGKTAEVALSALDSLVKSDIKVPPVTLKLIDILSLQTGQERAGLVTDLNLFDFVSASVQAAAKNNAIAANLNINLGLVGVNLILNIIQPPQWAIGNPKTSEVLARTAQISATVKVSIVGIPIDLGLKVASGEAKVKDYVCTKDKKSLKVDATTSAVNLNLNLLGLDVPLEVGKTTKEMNFNNVPRLNENPAVDYVKAEKIVTKLISNVKIVLQKNMGVFGLIVGFLLESLLSPLTLLLDAIVDSLLNALGIDIASLMVEAQLNCAYKAELVY